MYINKTASQRDLILSAQANNLFTEGRYFQAAQSYAQCSATFEEVTLKFLDVGERDSLRSYLISRLERTKKTVRVILDIRSLSKCCFLRSGSHPTDDIGYLAGRVLSQ